MTSKPGCEATLDFHDAVLDNRMTPLGELGRTIET